METAHTQLYLTLLRHMPSMHGEDREKKQLLLKSELKFMSTALAGKLLFPHKHYIISKEQDIISINNAVR